MNHPASVLSVAALPLEQDGRCRLARAYETIGSGSAGRRAFGFNVRARLGEMNDFIGTSDFASKASKGEFQREQ